MPANENVEKKIVRRSESPKSKKALKGQGMEGGGRGEGGHY